MASSMQKSVTHMRLVAVFVFALPPQPGMLHAAILNTTSAIPFHHAYNIKTTLTMIRIGRIHRTTHNDDG